MHDSRRLVAVVSSLSSTPAVSKAATVTVEHRDDLLLSILANYLHAAGATDPRIVVTTGGHGVEYHLPMLI